MYTHVLCSFLCIGNNSTHDGSNDTSDRLSNEDIIAIVSVLVAFLSLLATVGE